MKKVSKKISAGALILAALLSAANIGITAAGDKDIGADCFYGMRGLVPDEEEPIIEPFPIESGRGERGLNATVELYSDAEKTVPLKGDVPADSYVYYTVKAKDGYVCRRFVITADYVDDEKFMLGSHAFAAYAETYLMGDVTNDRVVNAEDLVRLMKCLADKHSNQFLFEVEWPCADTNMDNKVDSKDLVRTMRIVAGDKVESPACKSAAAAVESSETRLDTFQKSDVIWDIDDRNTGFTVINSVEELRAWAEKRDAEYPFDNTPVEELIESLDRDYIDYNVPGGKDAVFQEIRDYFASMALDSFDGIYEKYNAEFFEQHTLVIVSTPELHNVFAPLYIDSEMRGDVLTVIMENHPVSGVIPDCVPAIANSFIELPRTDAEKVALEVKPDYYRLLCMND